MRPAFSLTRLLWAIVALALLATGGFVGYRVIRAEVAAQVYKERLEQLAGEYETLRTAYNAAVRRSAVTELIVKNNKLSVRIRAEGGAIAEIAAPFDPRQEIYADYAVVDGKLWIRRLFDARTPPEQGLLIDPKLADIAWNDPENPNDPNPRATYGKAVYRTLTEGRWVVSVTGNGSLGLTRIGDADEIRLIEPPAIRDFSQMEAQAKRSAEDVSVSEVFRRFVQGG